MKKKKKPSKSAFIRAQSMTKSASLVRTEAMAQGLDINETYVHSVRSEMRKHLPKPSKVTAPLETPKPTPVPDRTPRAPFHVTAGIPAAPPRAVTVLLAAASELGLSQAIELLSNERTRVRGILG